MADRSNKYYVGTKDGVIKTYAVRRRPEDVKWSKEAVMEMMGTIEHPTSTAKWCEIPIRAPRGDQPSESPINIPVRGAEVIAARRLYLLPRDFEKYGVTAGCMGCRHKGAELNHRNHSQSCRDRITECVRKDPNKAERVKRAEDRANEATVNATQMQADESDKRRR